MAATRVAAILTPLYRDQNRRKPATRPFCIASRWRWRAGQRSTSSPAESKRPCDSRNRLPATRTLRSEGGVSTVRQYLKAGLADSVHLALAPVVLGTGEALFTGLDLAAHGFSVLEHRLLSERDTLCWRKPESSSRLGSTLEQYKRSVAGHDTECVQHYVVNVENAHAEDHLHQFHTEPADYPEDKRCLP